MNPQNSNNEQVQPTVSTSEPVATTQPSPQPTPQSVQDPTAPTPIQKKNKVSKIIIVIVALIVLMVVAGGVIAMLTTSKTVKSAENFVKVLTTKDFEAAYELFSPELKKAQSLEVFKQSFENAPFDSSCTFKIESRQASTSTSSGNTKKITGSINCGGETFPTELTFVGTDDGEKIITYDVKPAE